MSVNYAERPKYLQKIERKDKWWLQPLCTAVALVAFVIYSNVRVFENRFYDSAKAGMQSHYISPFYALPDFGIKFLTIPFVAALYALAIPVAFRASCYFCRRTFYRALFGDPSACAVKEILPRKGYTGERKFPFNLFNLHRYALYAVFILVVLHWAHLFEAFTFTHHGTRRFGIGLGSLLLALDTVMLTLYVASCHSLRHLLGGSTNYYSASGGNTSKYRIWNFLTRLNEQHALFFWLSLASIWIADVYIRFVIAGRFSDFIVL